MTPNPARLDCERHGVDLQFFCLALRWLVRRYGDCPAREDEIEELRSHLQEAEATYHRIVEAEQGRSSPEPEPPA